MPDEPEHPDNRPATYLTAETPGDSSLVKGQPAPAILTPPSGEGGT